MAKGIKKLISLVKKPGDKCIILDQEGEPAYVFLRLEDYEKLTGNKADVTELTEEELLNKINKDVAMWKTSQESQADDWYPLEAAIQDAKFRLVDSRVEENQLNLAKNNPEEDKYYFEPID